MSVTGVAGLTLGGGLGVMMRTHGLSCDNLRSVEIVTADGMVRTASRDEHTDLFWAVRGGGLVSAWSPHWSSISTLGPDVAAALVLYPYEDAASVLRAWRRRSPGPRHARPRDRPVEHPPAARRPRRAARRAGRHGRRRLHRTARRAGPVLAPLQQLGTPLADMTATMPYVESQSAVDDLFPDGGRYYWKSHFVDEITDELIDTLVALDADRPSPQSVIMIRTLGGAIGGVGDHETAYPHRSARFNISVDASWQDPELDDAAIAWARSTWDAIAPTPPVACTSTSPVSATTPTFGPPHSAPTRSARRDPPCLRPRQPLRRRRAPAMSPERLRSPAVAGTVAAGDGRGCRSACLVPADPTTSRQAQ